MVSVGRTVPGVKTVLRGLAVLFCLALGGPPFTSLRAAESTTVASGPRRVSLQLTRRHQIQFAGFYMAQELGYYREASLTGWLYAVRHMDETVARVQGSYATGADRKRLEREAQIISELMVHDTLPIGFIDPNRWHGCMQALAQLRSRPFDAQGSRDALLDTFLAARATRGVLILKAALCGTLLATLLLGGMALVLARIVRHRTAELARANLDLRREYEALKRAESMLMVQHDLALALLDVKSEAACLEQVVAACLRFPRVDGCGILRPAPGGRLLRMQVCAGMGSEAAASHAELALDSPCGAGLARGEPCRLDAGAIADAFPVLQRDGWVSIVLHPVRADHELVAVLCLGSRREGAGDWADLSGPVDVLLGSTLQRIGSEQAVRESESLLRSAAEGAIDGIALMAQDGRYLLVNARFAAMYGCPVAAMVGRHFSEFVPPEERDDKLRRFARRVQGDHKEIEYESRLQRKDGTFLPIRLTVSNVAWRGQRVFAIVLRDLSESKRLEQELLHIGEWERIRIGQDLHDTIGQQLAGMAYLIEVLARNLGREPSAHAREAKEIAQVAGTAHAQLRDVVQSLLPLPEYETLDAGLERICVLTRQRQGVACRLSVSGSGARKFNATAANHLLYIAREAIANAVRHGNARHIEVALRQDGEHGLLSIEDDGTGFDPGTERATGAGLRIMGYRADMLGGRLAVRRRVSGGTAVVCTFDPAVISGIAESPPQFAGMKAATAVQEKEKANDGAQ